MPARFKREPSHLIEVVYDANDLFAGRMGAQYLLGILQHYPLLDRNTLTCAYWILGPKLKDFILEVSEIVPKTKKERFLQDLNDCSDLDDYARETVGFAKKSKQTAGRILRCLVRHMEKRRHSLENLQESDIQTNVEHFQRLFSLQADEMQLCFFFFVAQNWVHLRDYLIHTLKVDEFIGRKYIHAALSISSSSLESILQGKLKTLGIIGLRGNDLEIEDAFIHLFIDPQNAIQTDGLYREALKAELTLNDHLFDAKHIAFLTNILKAKRKQPTHILLYGPAGTGKTSFARALVSQLPDPGYEVLQGHENQSQKRRAAIQACLNMTNNGAGSVLIVDEADHLLNTRNTFFFRGEVLDKGWLNNFMEEPGVRVIWIVNDLDEVEESVKRRFSYSLYFPKFSRQKRIRLWEGILKKNRVGRSLNEQAIQNLAADYEVSPGVINLAVRQAKETGSRSSSLHDQIRLALDAHLQLTHVGAVFKNAERLDHNFTLEGLNIQGDLDRLLQELQIVSTHLKKNDRQAIGQYNLLFFGPPGTGKSELARYIADQLDMDLMIKRGSDLLNPFVGMTEKLIANMFTEAEAKEAVLVIDEADSFIFGRNTATHSFEIGHVNEFLTRMERFHGILICTTNRFQGLDQASIRRFNRKVGFDYLNQKGIEIFYKLFLAPLCSDSLDNQLINKLQNFKHFTPGDFKNIRDRYQLISESITHNDLFTALEEEVRIKSRQGGGKVVGF